MDYNYKIQEKEGPEEEDKKGASSLFQKVFNKYTVFGIFKEVHGRGQG